MERKKLSGVGNIIRFNWHYYVLALCSVVLLLVIAGFASTSWAILLTVAAGLIVLTSVISLTVSAYIYDFSNLYSFNWVDKNFITANRIINIHAGFDETSHILVTLSPLSLLVFDFYNPATHTEISIERARKAYPPFPNTIKITTDTIPVTKNSTDTIFLTLAAHEIRHRKERVIFLKNLTQALNADGKIIVTEHLRDINNFLAFNIGFLHFFSKQSWLQDFKDAELKILSESNITPFLSTFVLQPYGTTP